MGIQERKRQKKIRANVIERDGLICCYCDLELTLAQVTMEHIVPYSKRGTFNTTNLTVSCGVCNNKRGNKPFFDYCKQFNFSEEKVLKYKNLYFNNLKIKILNIAKENCLMQEQAIPNFIIAEACKILKIKPMDFSYCENIIGVDIKFNEYCERRRIKYNFENLIKMIDVDDV